MGKQAFELKSGVNRVEITLPDGALVLEEGSVLETDESNEIRELEAHPDVKAAEKKGKG